MHLKNKLYLGFWTILLFLLLYTGGVLSVINKLNANMEEVVYDGYQKIHLVTSIRLEVGNISRDLRDIIISPEMTHDQKIEDIQRAQLKIAVALDALESKVNNSEMKPLVSEVKLIYNMYADTVKRILNLDKEGNRDQAKQMLLGEGKEDRLRMTEASEQIIALQETIISKELTQSRDLYHKLMITVVVAVAIVLIVMSTILTFMIRSISQSVKSVKTVMTNAADCHTSQLPRIADISPDEMGEIAVAYNKMAATIEQQGQHEQEYRQKLEEQSWLKSQVAETMTLLQGTFDLRALAQTVLSTITPAVGASYGVFYLKDGKGQECQLTKLAGYASVPQDVGTQTFRCGEGLVGQCAKENKSILLTQVPDNYIEIKSGLGTAPPMALLLLPITFEGNVKGVIELASLEVYTEIQRMMLEQVAANIGIVVNNILNYTKVQDLLKESQVLTEELQTQSEELQMQQEELRNINEQLEEQYKNAEGKAMELANTKQALEESAEYLALSSKYKSEFLANVSHELRTPLNSMLILAQVLAENSQGSLTEKEVGYARTIHSSGNDLLVILSDILDLSKVESGKLEIYPGDSKFSDIADFIYNQFSPMASQKALHFSVDLAADIPQSMYTDERRLQQILKNLLSNAFKFTHHGSVSFCIYKAPKREVDLHPVFADGKTVFAFAVNDSGIGIAPEKQQIIFDAFQQADGTTSRRFGGTGLGLSICREFARLLGGFITVKSVEGQGSLFTLYLADYNQGYETKLAANEEVSAGQEKPCNSDIVQYKSENENLSTEMQFQGKKILIADDDMRNVFALTTVLEDRQIQVYVAENGREAIDILTNNPDIDLVLMDIMMPEMDGYEALHFIRERRDYQNLPIIALTAKAMKYDREKCIAAGATDYISKPVDLQQLLSILHVWLYKQEIKQ